MKNVNKKICVVCMFLVVVCMSYDVYSATMYENDIRNDAENRGVNKKKADVIDKSSIGPKIDDETKKPTAEAKKNPNSIEVVDKNKKRREEEEGKIIPLETYTTPSEATREYSESRKFTYIRHTSGVTEVSGNYEFEDYVDENEHTMTRLLIHHSYDSPNMPIYARSGFYKVDGEIYCFDKIGNLIKGIAKDEYDIIYIFDEISGKFIEKYQG